MKLIKSYADLRDGLRARRKELRLPHLVLDDLAGLCSGYAGKIECGSRRLGPMSLAMLLAALDVELVVRPLRTPQPSYEMTR